MDDRRRIKCMSDRTAASIRGSQVIGSVPRAVEELVHNAVQGCARSCVVSAGPNEIVVSDDGAGIDPDAMRRFVGTEYCSNGADVGRKGETLRSIASLCVEMKIETASEGVEDRKRKAGVASVSSGGIVRSEKLFRDGLVVSFNQSGGNDTVASAIMPRFSSAAPKERTGTTITIRGLFHRMAVRRKHHVHANQEKATSSELTQIRACLRLLALVYPNVAFTLKNATNGVDCAYTSPEWALKFMGPLTSGLRSTSSSPSLSVESHALSRRLQEMYAGEFSPDDSLELAREESPSSAINTHARFRAFGVMRILDEDGDEVLRNKDLEIVAINGRLATHNDRLADIIFSQIRLCRGNKSNFSVRFFIHIYSNTGELVVKDSAATTAVPQIDRLAKFLKEIIAEAVMGNDQTMSYHLKDDDRGSVFTQSSNWNMNKRVVKGEYIKCSNFKVAAATKRSKKDDAPEQSEKQAASSEPESPCSPFSSAFFDNVQQPAKAEEMKPPAIPDSSLLCSFEDAFLGQDTTTKTENPDTTSNGSGDRFDDEFDDKQDTAAAAATWTRQRIKGLERNIAALAPEATMGSGEGEISLTKQMLEKADVIAQVEDKFIIIKTQCGVLCCVDQHAADERVALEKLENALFNPNMNEDDMIHMTKRSIRVSDILKQTRISPSKRVVLTQKDMSAVKHHWSTLQKWKFTFDEYDEKTLLITGLPSVCDRVASVNDFLDFVKQLGHFNGGDIKPSFVKTVLASNACRYAIMFGDSLTHEKCVELIASLSRCMFCFICAHGRPSIIPLVDLNNRKSESPAGNAGEGGRPAVAVKNLKFGPKRVLRR